MDRTCQWAQDDMGGDDVWETQCGQAFQFNDGGPAENSFKFCAYCGGNLVEARTSSGDAADD
jgi:rRNA maturation endonuclease Nob1